MQRSFLGMLLITVLNTFNRHKQRRAADYKLGSLLTVFPIQLKGSLAWPDPISHGALSLAIQVPGPCKKQPPHMSKNVIIINT